MTNNTDNKLSDDNIFSELSKDIEETSIEEVKTKDASFYIKLVANIL
jgi:hypothetical protein